MDTFLQSLFDRAKSQPAVYRVHTIAALVNKRLPQRVIYASNIRKSHPMQYRYGKNKFSIFIHAEINAIRQALRHLSLDEISKSKLYVVRAKQHTDTKEWILGNACPCRGCKMAITAFGIKKVQYSTDHGFDILEEP